MPVTVQINGNTPQPWRCEKARTAEKLLQDACPSEYKQSEKILQTSFSKSMLQENYITPAAHGFVTSMIRAYSNHHPISIRPEDVWFAILSQVGFYIIEHGEELRSFFVAHEGKKKLEVRREGTVETVDFGDLAKEMTDLIQNNVVDPTLRAWIMPSFSTTTDTDLVVAAVLMMGSMATYFTYQITLTCGMPSVTLLGERDDWQQIYDRLDKMTQWGEEPALFVTLLKPVLRRFLASFDDPTSPDVVSFWARSVDRHSDSGVDYCSGWVAAFCLWDEKGKRIQPGMAFHTPEELELDGVKYQRIDIENVPPGCMGVPVTINDNGNVFDARMVAGSAGIKASVIPREPGAKPAQPPRSRQQKPPVGPEAALEPVVGWWIFSVKEE